MYMIKHKPSFESAMNKLRHNAAKVAMLYADEIIQILENEPSTVNGAINGNLFAYQSLLLKIITKLNAIRNINTDISIEMYPGTGAGKTGGSVFLVSENIHTGEKYYKIIIFQDNINDRLIEESSTYKNATIDERNKILFASIVASFSHEYGHFIDTIAPQHGALGTEFELYNGGIYDRSSHEKYMSHPTEISSHKIADVVKRRVGKWLKTYVAPETLQNPMIQKYLNTPRQI